MTYAGSTFAGAPYAGDEETSATLTLGTTHAYGHVGPMSTDLEPPLGTTRATGHPVSMVAPVVMSTTHATGHPVPMFGPVHMGTTHAHGHPVAFAAPRYVTLDGVARRAVAYGPTVTFSGVTAPDWEFEILEQGSDTVVAAIDSTMTTPTAAPLLEAEFMRQANGPGRGRIVVPNSSAFLAQLQADRLLRLNLRGSAAFCIILDPPEQTLVSEAEEVGENSTCGGPSTFAKLAEGVVKPSNGFDAQPKQIDRPFGWKDINFDHSDWEPAYQLAVFNLSDTVHWGYPRVGWPDTTAYHLGSSLYDLANFRTPSGFYLYVKEFTAPADGLYTGYGHGDDLANYFIDGQLVMTTENNGLLGTPSASHTHSFTLFLTAGTHFLAVELLNYYPPGVTAGPEPEDQDPALMRNASLLFAMYSGPGIGAEGDDPGTLLFHSDSSWSVFYTHDVQPGMTAGQALRLVLSENQALPDTPACLNVVPTFTDEFDSAGVAWTQNPNMATKVGTDVLTFALELAATDMDTRMQPSGGTMFWDAWVKGTRGGDSGVTLELGVNLRRLETKSARKVADGLMVGYPPAWRLVTDPTAGFHKVATLGLGTAQDEQEVDRVAATQLDVYKQHRVSLVAGQAISDGTPDAEYPIVTFEELDTFTVEHPALDGGALTPQVLSIAAKYNTSKALFEFDYELGDVVTNPPITGEAERFVLAVNKMSKGTVGGTSPVATPTILIPRQSSIVAPQVDIVLTFGEQVAYWPMDDGSGNPVDTIQALELVAKNGGSTVTPTWITGDPVMGTCIDATAQVFETLRSYQFGLDGGYTLTAWVYADSEPTNAGIGFVDYNASGVGMIAAVGVGDVDYHHAATVISAINVNLVGIWQMYAQTWDGVTLRAFVGTYGGGFTQVGATSETGVPGRAEAQPPDYGTINGYGGSDHLERVYPGRLGPVGIWNGPLSLTELTARFTSLL